MSFQVEARAQAFGAGASLWIMPGKESCALVKKADWYLNFNIERAQKHKPQELSPGLLDRLRLENLNPLDFRCTYENQLAIVTQNSVSAELVVVLPLKKTFKDWVQEAKKIWQNLKSPTTRIFLPDGESQDEFLKHWGPQTLNQYMSIVVSL